MKIFVSREDGNIHTDFEGFKGKTCLKEAEEFFEELKKIGIETNSIEITPKAELSMQESERNVIEH